MVLSITPHTKVFQRATMIPQRCNKVALLVLLLFVSITNAFQSSSSFMGSSVLPAAQKTLEGRSTMTMEYIRKCNYPKQTGFLNDKGWWRRPLL
jgi:hypothetical protein